MQISGLWLICDDGAARPVIRGEILAGDGSWVKAPFLLDTGADRTVFSAVVLAALGLQPLATRDRLGGLGGQVDSVVVETQVRVFPEAHLTVISQSRYQTPNLTGIGLEEFLLQEG